MTKHKSLILRFSLIAITLILSCGFLLMGTMRSTTSSKVAAQNSPREVKIRVKNLTQSFNLVSLERKPGQVVQLTLRNDYPKSITAFALSPRNDRYVQRPDFLFSDDVINPNQTHVETCTIPELADRSSEMIEVIITIRAVVFDDGTSDGDRKMVDRIKDTRLGKKIQTQRIIALLRNALNSSSLEPQKALSGLLTRIRGLSISQQQGLSVFVKGGLHNAKEKAILELQAIELRQMQDGYRHIQPELASIIDRYERILAKL